jgi:cytochrome c553
LTIAARRLATAVAALLLGAAPAALAAPAAPFEDTMAQRVLACTGCHGPEGRAAPDGYYPRIAGKPAGYLANQLLNFRDGRRPYALMSGLLAPLSDAYLREIAGHFAALELPYPPPAPAGLSESAQKLAARLVNEGDASRKLPACTACHGDALTGTAPFVPGLVGLPRDYLNAQLGAWRTGKRVAQSPDCMAEVARMLAADEIATLSSWLAARPVPVNAKPAATFRAPVPMPCGGVETTTPKAP